MSLKAVVFIFLANDWLNVGANHCKLNDVISNGNLVFNDLSHEFDGNTVYWPNVRPFEFTKKQAENTENGWYAANEFEAGEHGGTHMDAPYHFYREGKFVGEIPLENLILPLIIVDISSLVNGDPNFILHKHHLDHLLNNNNGKPCMIIFKFGWSKFYGDKKKYLGTNETEGALNFPGKMYAANEFEAGEHGGTHMDAPYHFYREGKFVGEIPLENLILPLIIVDISSLVNGDPNFILHKHHLDHLLNNNNGKPCMIIFKFGWSKFYGDKKKYLGTNETEGALNFPGLSEEIAEWLTTAHKNIVGVGVDVASLDPGSSKTFPVHKILLAAGVYGMENVKLDGPLPDYGCTGVAMPMKIAKGTGGPLRLAALCPKRIPTHF